MIPVYVLNLARSPERRAFMAEGCAKAGVAPLFVAAVDGRKRRIVREDARLSVGETALVLSHRKAWRRLLASPNAYAVILEDDVHFGADFADLLAADWRGLVFDAIKFETMFDPVWVALSGPAIAGRRVLRLGTEHHGSAGYLVSRAGATKLLAATRALDTPVDHALFGRAAVFGGRMAAFQLDPAAVVQDVLLPDPARRHALATTLHDPDRQRLFAARRQARARGWRRLGREVGRLAEQVRRLAWLWPRMTRRRVPFA